MLKIIKLSETVRKRVYTDNGDYFGDVEEASIENNKIAGWRIKIGGQISSALGGARGVIIPHHFVKAIGDIIIISKASLPEDSLDKTQGKTESLM